MTDMPLEHVQRPQPPWRRDQQVTECGLPLDGHPVLTREEFITKLRAQGKQRSALTTCMTCWQTASRHPSWEENPVASVIREARRWMSPYRQPEPGSPKVAFRDELLAIAELIERHREEFDAILAGLGDTISLSDARKQRRRRRA